MKLLICGETHHNNSVDIGKSHVSRQKLHFVAFSMSKIASRTLYSFNQATTFDDKNDNKVHHYVPTSTDCFNERGKLPALAKPTWWQQHIPGPGPDFSCVVS